MELIILQQAYFFQNESRIVWADKLVPLGNRLIHTRPDIPLGFKYRVTS